MSETSERRVTYQSVTVAGRENANNDMHYAGQATANQPTASETKQTGSVPIQADSNPAIQADSREVPATDNKPTATDAEPHGSALTQVDRNLDNPIHSYGGPAVTALPAGSMGYNAQSEQVVWGEPGDLGTDANPPALRCSRTRIYSIIFMSMIAAAVVMTVWATKDHSCGSPGNLENGRVIGSFDYGEKIAYKCDNGYSLEGTSTRECLDVGIWSGTDSRCLRTY